MIMVIENSSGYLLNGDKIMVLLVEIVELFLIVVMFNGKLRLFVVESGSEGLSIEKKFNMGVCVVVMGDI